MVKAVIFDLNGIFIRSPKLSDRIYKDFGISEEEFMPKLNEIMQKVRKPNASGAFSYWKPELQKWAIKLDEKEFWRYWFEAEIPSDEMIELAKELKNQRIGVLVLSNNFRERAEYYDHYPWMHNVVDKVYFSWQTGLVKPDINAWMLVLQENNLRPEECLYFDDQEKNIKAAESVGIKSFIFTDVKTIKRIIEDNL